MGVVTNFCQFVCLVCTTAELFHLKRQWFVWRQRQNHYQNLILTVSIFKTWFNIFRKHRFWVVLITVILPFIFEQNLLPFTIWVIVEFWYQFGILIIFYRFWWEIFSVKLHQVFLSRFRLLSPIVHWCEERRFSRLFFWCCRLGVRKVFCIMSFLYLLVATR